MKLFTFVNGKRGALIGEVFDVNSVGLPYSDDSGFYSLKNKDPSSVWHVTTEVFSNLTKHTLHPMHKKLGPDTPAVCFCHGKTPDEKQWTWIALVHPDFWVPSLMFLTLHPHEPSPTEDSPTPSTNPSEYNFVFSDTNHDNAPDEFI